MPLDTVPAPAAPPLSVRIAVIGAGTVGAAHVRAASGARGHRITAVCDVDRGAAERLAAPIGAAVHTDYRRMLASGCADAVVVTAPHSLHAPMVRAAAEAGVHVLVEKPMATTVEECTAMIEACRDRGVLLAVGHVIHFDPVAGAARALVASGEYGAPLLAAHRRSAHYDPGSRPAWFFDPALAGGGIVLNVGTHGLDRISWLAGAPVERVTGVTRSRPGMSIETDALALVELANGVHASLTLTSRGAPFYDLTEVIMDDATLRLSAEEGLALLRDGTSTVVRAREPGDLARAFTLQLDGFAEAVRGGRGTTVDGAWGRSVVAAALALYDSARTGNPAAPRVPAEAE